MADLYPRPIEGVASKMLPWSSSLWRQRFIKTLPKQEIISARLSGEENASLFRPWYRATTSPARIGHIDRRETKRTLQIRRPNISMDIRRMTSRAGAWPLQTTLFFFSIHEGPLAT